MRSKSSLAILLAAACFVGGCSSSSETGSNSAGQTPQIAASPTPITGEAVKFERAGLQITVPDGYTQKKSGNETIVTSTDGSITMRVSVAEAGYEKSAAEVEKTLATHLQEVRIDDRGQSEMVGDLETRYFNGGGKEKETGKSVIWDLKFFQPDKTPLMALVYGEKTSFERHGPMVQAVLRSVKIVEAGQNPKR